MRFKPMALPEGIYMTQIESYLQTAYGVDQNGDLWTWGMKHVEAGEEEMQKIYRDRDNTEGEGIQVPLKNTWLIDKGLKVLKLQTGMMSAVIETKNMQNGEKELYGMLHEEYDTKGQMAIDIHRMLGKSSLENIPELPTVMKKIVMDMQNYKTFACSKFCTYIV